MTALFRAGFAGEIHMMTKYLMVAAAAVFAAAPAFAATSAVSAAAVHGTTPATTGMQTNATHAAGGATVSDDTCGTPSGKKPVPHGNSMMGASTHTSTMAGGGSTSVGGGMKAGATVHCNTAHTNMMGGAAVH